VVIISGTLDRTAVVNFFTTDGSATSTAPVDFIAVMGTNIVFDADTSSSTELIAINDDNILENLESFFGNLNTNDSAVIIAPDSTRVDILEDTVDSKFFVWLRYYLLIVMNLMLLMSTYLYRCTCGICSH